MINSQPKTETQVSGGDLNCPRLGKAHEIFCVEFTRTSVLIGTDEIRTEHSQEQTFCSGLLQIMMNFKQQQVDLPVSGVTDVGVDSLNASLIFPVLRGAQKLRWIRISFEKSAEDSCIW